MARRAVRVGGFSDLVVAWRERLGRTRPEIAARCGVSASTVKRWERGSRPSSSQVGALEDALRLSASERAVLEAALRP